MGKTIWTSKTKEEFHDIDDHLKKKTRTWSDVEGDVETIRERIIERNGRTEIEYITVHPTPSKYRR